MGGEEQDVAVLDHDLVAGDHGPHRVGLEARRGYAKLKRDPGHGLQIVVDDHLAVDGHDFAEGGERIGLHGIAQRSPVVFTRLVERLQSLQVGHLNAVHRLEVHRRDLAAELGERSRRRQIPFAQGLVGDVGENRREIGRGQRAQCDPVGIHAPSPDALYLQTLARQLAQPHAHILAALALFELHRGRIVAVKQVRRHALAHGVGRVTGDGGVAGLIRIRRRLGPPEGRQALEDADASVGARSATVDQFETEPLAKLGLERERHLADLGDPQALRLDGFVPQFLFIHGRQCHRLHDSRGLFRAGTGTRSDGCILHRLLLLWADCPRRCRSGCRGFNDFVLRPCGRGAHQNGAGVGGHHGERDLVRLPIDRRELFSVLALRRRLVLGHNPRPDRDVADDARLDIGAQRGQLIALAELQGRDRLALLDPRGAGLHDAQLIANAAEGIVVVDDRRAVVQPVHPDGAGIEAEHQVVGLSGPEIDPRYYRTAVEDAVDR